MKYLVIYERAADGGIWGYAPDLPGATGKGDTLDEARESVTAGIAIWIDEMKKSGQPIPESTTVSSELLEVAAA
jgi:predicted RNase H-like HicB family nuclease